MNTLISVVVPCYKQDQYLPETLQSILNQSYQNWECIIVNDGSPDNTEEIALKWCEKDTRFKYIKKENGGLSSARNAGIKIAEGNWILPLDSDDIISKDYLNEASERFNDEKLKIIYCNAEKFGKQNGKWELPEFSIDLLAKRNIIFCSAFFRKKDWTDVGGYDGNMRDGLEDWDFWISLLKNGGEVYRLEKTCFYYRIKNKSMITEMNKEKFSKVYTYLAYKHSDFFIKNIGTFHDLYGEKEKYKNFYIKITKSKKYKFFRFLNNFNFR